MVFVLTVPRFFSLILVSWPLFSGAVRVRVVTGRARSHKPVRPMRHQVDTRHSDEQHIGPSTSDFASRFLGEAKEKELSALLQQSQDFSGGNATAEVSVMFVVSVVCGILWLLSAIAGIIYRVDRRRALGRFQEGGLERVEEERQATCALLESLYDGLNFQIHGLRVLLRALAGDETLAKLDDPHDQNVDPMWLPWRSVMKQIESQLLMLYSAVADPDLCHKEPGVPVVRHAAQRANTMAFPRGFVTASALLIVAGLEKLDDNTLPLTAQAQERSIEFVSRFLTYLDATFDEELPRSGTLFTKFFQLAHHSNKNLLHKHNWWTLDVARGWLQAHTDDASEPPVVLAHLGKVERMDEDGRPCMKLFRFGAPILIATLCHSDQARLQEWITSLNHHRCKSWINVSASAMTLRKSQCHEEMNIVYKAHRKNKFDSLEKMISVPQAWMQLPWRQRSLEARVLLNCETPCRLKGLITSPQRKSAVLLFERMDDSHFSRHTSGKNMFVLLNGGSFTYFDSFTDQKPRGTILVRNMDFKSIGRVKPPRHDGPEQDTWKYHCFGMEASKDSKLKSYRCCTMLASERDAWVVALREAYTRYFGVRLVQREVGRKIIQDVQGPDDKEGSVLACIAASRRASATCWVEQLSIILKRDRMLIIFDGQILEWPYASIKMDTVKIGQIHEDDVSQKCVTRDLPPMPDGYPNWTPCFCFETDGVFVDKGRHVFCGDHAGDGDKRNVWWHTALRDALARFEDEGDMSPRDGDATWGESLLRNPLDSPRAAFVLDELLKALPDAQYSGQAVLCPPNCICPLFVTPLAFQDISPYPKGRAVYEVRSCGTEPAEVRSVKFKFGMYNKEMLELRLRGFRSTHGEQVCTDLSGTYLVQDGTGRETGVILKQSDCNGNAEGLGWAYTVSGTTATSIPQNGKGEISGKPGSYIIAWTDGTIYNQACADLSGTYITTNLLTGATASTVILSQTACDGVAESQSWTYKVSHMYATTSPSMVTGTVSGMPGSYVIEWSNHIKYLQVMVQNTSMLTMFWKAGAAKESPRLSSIVASEGFADMTCDSAELSDLLRLLWRFSYHRDAEPLSKKIPRQQGQNTQALAVLVLQPLLQQYSRETHLHLPDLEVAWDRGRKCKFCNAFKKCDSEVLWHVLLTVEREELQLLEVLGNSASQTSGEINTNFHQRPLDPAHAMLLAAEFWRSMNEHGCAPTELWHPLEKSCYTFCLSRRKCIPTRQKWPGHSSCKVRSQHVPASTGLCQAQCKVLFPGHPGCDLGDPSEMPKSVEDFYKQTAPGAFEVARLAAWDAPRTLMPCAQFFMQYPQWFLKALEANVVLVGVDKIFGFSSSQAIAHGVQTLSGMAMALGSAILSLSYLLYEIYGIYNTYQKYVKTRNYLEKNLEEKIKEMRFLKCRLLSSMLFQQEEIQEDGNTVREQLLHQMENTPKFFDRLRHTLSYGSTSQSDVNNKLQALLTEICDGPLPRGFERRVCQDTLRATAFQDQQGRAGGVRQVDQIFMGLFRKLLQESDGKLREEVRECKTTFPSVAQGRYPVPLSSVHAVWFNPAQMQEEDDDFVELVRKQSNIDFRPIMVETKPGEEESMDAKMGMTAPLQTVLLAARDPASSPLSDLMVYHVPRPKDWKQEAALSPPSQEELDMAVHGSLTLASAVGLAPGSPGLQKPDPTSSGILPRFKSFKRKAFQFDYADSERAGGFVNLNFGCANHKTEGRDDAMVLGGGQTEVFLSTRAGSDLPPLIDMRLSSDPFNEELAAKGFLRVAPDINKECAMWPFGTPAYIYYKREWVTRPSFVETRSQGKRVKYEVERCLSSGRGSPVPLGPQYSMMNDQRCIRCDCENIKDGQCYSLGPGLGLVEGYVDLGVDAVSRQVRRQRMVFVGEINVRKIIGDSESSRDARISELFNSNFEHFRCEARGVGQLWYMTQNLVQGGNTSTRVEQQRESVRQVQPRRSFTQAALSLFSISQLGSTKPRLGSANSAVDDGIGSEGLLPERAPDEQGQFPHADIGWVASPDHMNDFYFKGEVHEYGDVELFQQHRGVPAHPALDLLCEKWESRRSAVAEASNWLQMYRAAEWHHCLARLKQDARRSWAEILQQCFSLIPVDLESLSVFHGPNVRSSFSDSDKADIERALFDLKRLAQRFERNFKDRVVDHSDVCGFGGLKQRKPDKFLKKMQWSDKKVTLTRSRLVIMSCKKAGKHQNIELDDVVLSPEIKYTKMEAQTLGCFTLSLDEDDLELCADMENARRWHHRIGKAMIQEKVGAFSSPFKWLDAATELKCDEDPRLSEGNHESYITPKLERRPLPDGFGELFEMADDSPNYIRSKGKFARGAQAGVGEIRYTAGASVTVGKFRRGALSFGTSVLSRDAMQKAAQGVLSGFEHVLGPERALFASKNSVFTGFWLGKHADDPTSTQAQWPAHIGTLRDMNLRPLYWGQFALWLPWGLGVWCDYSKGYMFRGVVKKEYKSFKIGSSDPNPYFVPLLAGELTRLRKDDPIPGDGVDLFPEDSAVLEYFPEQADTEHIFKYGKESIPSSLKRTKELYFSGLNARADLVCRSKALFKWSEWLDSIRRIVKVWIAIDGNERDSYQSILRITPSNDAVNLMAGDMYENLRHYVMIVLNFRKHLMGLRHKPRGHEIGRRLTTAVQVLTQAASRGQDYESEDWGGLNVLDVSIAKQLASLGPSAYLQFNGVDDFIQACNAALDFATSSYCMLCSEDIVQSSVPKRRVFPELEVKISHARGMLNGYYAMELSVFHDRVKPLMTEFTQAILGEVRWDSSLLLDGKERPLAADTWMELKLIKKAMPGRAPPVVASWKTQLVDIIGRRGDLEWLELESSEQGPATDGGVPLAVGVAFSMKNPASISGQLKRTQHIVPEGCGATYAVKRLIENNEMRLRHVEVEVQRLVSEAGDLARHVAENNFDGSANPEPAVEHYVPNPVYDPPRANVEGSLHDDVFGGIHASDNGPSIPLFYDDFNGVTSNFFAGPHYFEDYVRRSNPANYGFVPPSRGPTASRERSRESERSKE